MPLAGRRRVWLRPALCLALGLSSTVGVALAGFLLIGFPAPGPGEMVDIPHNLPDSLLLLSEFEAAGGTMLVSTTASTVTQLGGGPAVPMGTIEDRLPSWCRARVLRLEPDVPWLLRSESRGWPCRALWAEEGFEPSTRSYVYRGGRAVTLPWRRINEATALRGRIFVPLLPLAPIWGGFLLDTAVYTALWSGLILGVPTIRRVRRRRHGRCPRCAYDLKHEFTRGCPECGWGRAAAPVETVPGSCR